MLIAAHHMFFGGKRLPYDAEVEYLESTGTQYIDTGVDYFADFEITAKLRTSVSNVTLYAGNANRFERDSATSPTWRFRSGAGGIYNTTVPITELHTLAWRNGKVYSDGVEITTHAKDFPANRMYVFGFPAVQHPAMVYALKLWDANGVLVRDFIPVRKGTVGYLYDRVSGKLFGNAGTGDFVLGPDVVPVEYIESHGTEYIKPDVSLATNDSFALNITGAFTGASSVAQFHGVNGGAYFGVQTNDNFTVGGLETNVPRDSAMHRWEMSATIGNSKTVSLNLDGTTYSRTRNNAEGHISLFALVFGSGGNPTYFCKFKMSTATIYKNGGLARKLLPVRVGTEGAMMDVLTRRIYRNAGTGAFTYGNDLPYPIPT